MRHLRGVGAVLVLIAAGIPALAAVTKHEERAPIAGSRVRVEVAVEVRSEHVPPDVLDAVRMACLTTLPRSAETSTTATAAGIAVLVSPAPDPEGLRPFIGCLNDVTVDHIQTRVVAIERR